jgi:tetratricopeptide (TPR) repeat protein
MNSSDALLERLLEEILEGDLTEEVALREHPGLASALHERLVRLRHLDHQLDAILPAREERTRSRPIVAPGQRLPLIPGYDIESIIGCGGMGVVYRARHLALHRPVAIKMLLAGAYAHTSELQRFRREAESIAALRSPNIVQVFDAGECDGHPYFVMEFVEGGSLADKLAGQPQPARSAAELVATLARAVHGAHRAGVSHRDLKPSNILLTADGIPKIADFGLAQREQRGESSEALTIPGARLGTPSYMSPEQAAGSVLKFCPLVDIYALGTVLYEMLTGRPPFRGETIAETERQVIADEPVAPSKLNPRTPRDLQTICLTCLQKDPARRYASAADLADDLDRFLAGSPIKARATGAIERAWRWARRRPALVALIITVGMFVSTAIGTGLWIAHDLDRRQNETAIREGLSREAVESAMSRVVALRHERRWPEAEGVIAAARLRLVEANDDRLAARLNDAERDLTVARDLDVVRQRFASPGVAGYDYGPADSAYTELFRRVGFGPETPFERAAAIIAASPIREELLAALDQAAFVCRVLEIQDRLAWALELARRADPDPWRDRFRTPSAWFDRTSLLELADAARVPNATARSHQLVLIGVLLSGFGPSEETLKPLRDAQRSDPSDFWVNIELANALRGAGKTREAIEYLRAATAIRPDNYVAWTALGAFQGEVNQRDQALASLAKAVELDPTYPTSALLFAQLLAQVGRETEAIELCERFTRDADGTAPDQPAIEALWFLHGRLLAGLSRWADARDIYSRVRAGVWVDGSEALFERAAVFLLSGDDAGYETACNEMLALLREGKARSFLVARAFSLRAWDADACNEAFRLARKELAEYANTHWSLIESGAILYREGSLAAAFVPLDAGLDVAPEAVRRTSVTLLLALVQLGSRDSTSAVSIAAPARAWFTTGAGRKPPDSEMHLHDWLEANVLLREFDSAISASTNAPGERAAAE